jgi:hypothetical protein
VHPLARSAVVFVVTVEGADRDDVVGRRGGDKTGRLCLFSFLQTPFEKYPDLRAETSVFFYGALSDRKECVFIEITYNAETAVLTVFATAVSD